MLLVLFYALGFEQIEIQERRNRPLPPGWAVDADGKVSFIMIINISIQLYQKQRNANFSIELEKIYYIQIEILLFMNYLLFPQETYDPQKVKGLLPLGGIEESSELCHVKLKIFNMVTIMSKILNHQKLINCMNNFIHVV